MLDIEKLENFIRKDLTEKLRPKPNNDEIAASALRSTSLGQLSQCNSESGFESVDWESAGVILAWEILGSFQMLS